MNWDDIVINIKQFLLAGNAIFTVTSIKTGARFTYRVSQSDTDPARYFVAVLTGPDNTRDFTYAGILRRTLRQDRAITAYQTRGSRIAATAPSWLGFVWLISRIDRPDVLAEQCTVHHEGRCGRCGRPLTVPESIESGFGPECIKKIAA